MDIIQTIEMSEFEDTLGYFEKVEILKDINKKIQAIVRERKTINRIMIESSEYSLLKLEKLEINNQVTLKEKTRKKNKDKKQEVMHP